ncbi:hypothetical protein GCM10010347_43010 [Streptomyces cirratus]|uniref:Uncharacterized protein n=1 Tax=Streptomyces cirratus TaxID=68187 RepID=A0ABQ3F0U0_9ACTN|nr:hypothetical protein GCM10010347_43010 [Streptomyces cirratus]
MEAVAEAVRPWLDKDAGEPPPAAGIVAALQAAETEHGGRRRGLWGRAAGNTTRAMNAGGDDLSAGRGPWLSTAAQVILS